MTRSQLRAAVAKVPAARFQLQELAGRDVEVIFLKKAGKTYEVSFEIPEDKALAARCRRIMLQQLNRAKVEP